MTSYEWQSQRVLVIGLGYLGAAIASRLRHEGVEVVALTPKPSIHTSASVLDGTDVVYGRAEDPATLNGLVGNIDHIVYTAGGLLPVEAAEQPVHDAAQMILPWIATLEALRRHPGVGVTFVSSGGTVYGNPSRIPVRETDLTSPVSPYGASRQACALYAGAYAQTHGLRIQVVRCANIYGRQQPHNRSQGVVAVFLHRILRRMPITIFGDGSAVRDYVYIDDAVGAITHIACDRTPIDVVNVGSGRGHTTLEIVHKLVEISGVAVEVVHAPERSHDVRAIVLDVTRLRSLIDYNPVSIDEGLHRAWSQAVGGPLALRPSA